MSLTIFEGPDGGGKTATVDYIRQKTSPYCRTIHFGPMSDVKIGIEKAYLARVLQCGLYSDTLFDRSWLSEPIYANRARAAPSRVNPVTGIMLELAASPYRPVVVLCLPPREAAMRTWSNREEMVQDRGVASAIYDDYASGMRTYLPVVRFDYTSKSVDELLDEIHIARDQFWSLKRDALFVSVKPQPYDYVMNSNPFVNVWFDEMTRWPGPPRTAVIQARSAIGQLCEAMFEVDHWTSKIIVKYEEPHDGELSKRLGSGRHLTIDSINHETMALVAKEMRQ